MTLTLPPLRDRPEDVLALAKHFLGRKRLSEDAQRLLLSYAWPGNVRELRNAIERAALVTDAGIIDAASLPVGDLIGSCRSPSTSSKWQRCDQALCRRG